MEIYILRHGIAEEPKAGARDADRALTSEGRKKLREVMRVAQKAGVSPSLILSSPYRRAFETAQVAAEILGYREEILQTRALIPSSDPKAVWEEIRAHKQAKELLLVGHEPLFGCLVGHLLGTPALQMDFKKGALVRVDLDQFGVQPRGVLRWMLTPRLAGVD